MARYTHIVSGARVQVRDDKVMDSSRRSLAADGTELPGGEEGYEAMTVPKLRAEIERRNESRGDADRLSAEGKKADLVAALEADDVRADQ